MIRASVVGASGYTGAELVRLLAGHPAVALGELVADRRAGAALADVFPGFRDVVARELVAADDWQQLGRGADVVFLALPHGQALAAVPRILAGGARVVDLGPDFRLRDAATYETWYGRPHGAADALAGAVYGLPELHRPAIRTAAVVANPGCYATAAALALLPLVEAGLTDGPVCVDGKSGASGAGRQPSESLHFAELNENVRAYNVAAHRHTPEIEQTLADAAGRKLPVVFAPHIVPMTRGILVTCYVPLRQDLSQDTALDLYCERYAGEPFVRVLQEALPATKATWASNFCDVALRVDAERSVAVALAALDNLVKGAAGQAVQNMNLMFDRPETEGLWAAPVYP
jgi:N-acetyl-gamma-glutamyl-phosphate reductase